MATREPPTPKLTETDDALNLLDDLVARARRGGADAADAILANGIAVSVTQRMGKREKMERAEGNDLGLRVFVGKRQAIASSSDWTSKSLDELVERALAMAKSVPEDPHCGLAEENEVFLGPFIHPDICDDAEPSPAQLGTRAKQCEDAARSVSGVTNSEGADAGWSLSEVSLLASNGFAGSYTTSRHSISAAVLAGEGEAMERDYDYSTSVYLRDLEEPEVIGISAGVRATSRLGAKKVQTAKVPIVYDPRVASSLLSHFASAANGASVARGTSFLKDRMGEQIFSDGVAIIDDPQRPRGLRSKPFDAEGMANPEMALVEEGRLRNWVLDLRSARQLGLKTNGRASRGTSSPPGPSVTNLYMRPGKVSAADLIGDIVDGFYVIELIGMGVNMVTGDYSRGAAGFWIENGEVTYPVNEVTIAGNLKDIFMNMTPANDLEFRYGINAPTIRVEGLTIAGAAATED
jgi:PmbA protein